MRTFVMRLFGAFLFAAILLGGCSDDDEPVSFVFVVDELPGDFPDQPLFLCVAPEAEGSPAGSFVGYRGTVSIDSDVYQETAFIRLSAFDSGEMSQDQLLEEQSVDAGSSVESVVGDFDAIAFTRTTAEPVRFPWPGFSWQQDGATLSILGEGLDRGQVLTAAESVRLATPTEIEAGGLLGQEQCE